METRRTFLIATAALPLAGLFAAPLRAATAPVFATGGIAINGHDPVAYFSEKKPVMGAAENTLDWNGAIWNFASAKNRDLFAANPEAYAPQYGGYCAFAMARGYIAQTVPEAWSIYENKLYLNYSIAVRSMWSQDIPGHIQRAKKHWPTILNA